MNIRQLWNNYKLVQWDDGMYGVRKGWLFHRFKDFSTRNDLWWELGNRWIIDCKTPKEKAEEFFNTPPSYTVLTESGDK